MGKKARGWIVLDYGSVIVHVFSRDQREFYALDKMWSDGEQVDLSELLTEVGGIFSVKNHAKHNIGRHPACLLFNKRQPRNIPV